jgi:hypothetical protein
MGSSNAFITKLKKTGDFVWAINYGSTFQNGGTFVNSIALDSDNSIINSGSYGTSADMNPGQGNFELQGGGNYIMKLRNCNPIVENLNIVNCGNYIGSNNVTYTSSGIYNYTTTNINGCDSIITLNLTILPTQSNSVSISQCDSYTSPLGNTYNSSGSYTETYSNVNGCDSIVTLNLTLNYTAINENNSSSLVISPNPTNGAFTIAGLELYNNISTMHVSDVNGKLVKVLDPTASKFNLETVKSGVYFLTITAGDKQEVIKIIKE